MPVVIRKCTFCRGGRPNSVHQIDLGPADDLAPCAVDHGAEQLAGPVIEQPDAVGGNARESSARRRCRGCSPRSDRWPPGPRVADPGTRPCPRRPGSCRSAGRPAGRFPSWFLLPSGLLLRPRPRRRAKRGAGLIRPAPIATRRVGSTTVPGPREAGSVRI